MPDGSSSAAPVIKPGPSPEKKVRTRRGAISFAACFAVFFIFEAIFFLDILSLWAARTTRSQQYNRLRQWRMNSLKIRNIRTAATKAIELEAIPITRDRIHPHKPRLARKKNRLTTNPSDKRICK